MGAVVWALTERTSAGQTAPGRGSFPAIEIVIMRPTDKAHFHFPLSFYPYIGIYLD